MDSNLLEVSEEKDLGVIIDKDLKLHSHTALVVNKANRLLGLLKHCFINPSSTLFTNLYKALIHPVLEYGNTIWGPFYTTDINKLENIQRKATKLILTIHHEDRLRSLKLPNPQYRRHRGDMIMLYNLLHSTYDLNVSDLFTFAPNNYLTRGHYSNTYPSRTDLRKNSFSRCVINSWNYLPGGIANTTSTNNFKYLFDKFNCNLMYDVYVCIRTRSNRLQSALIIPE